MLVNQQKIINDKGHVTGYFIKKNDFNRLKEYIEYIEDSYELAKSIHESEGFLLWDDFVKKNNLVL